MSTFPIAFHDAGSASLDDPAALARMDAIWQDNVRQMAECARHRGWDVDGPERQAGLNEQALKKLEAECGCLIPPQLRWALGQAESWSFDWTCSNTDQPPGDLRSCYSGGIRGAVWNAQWLPLHQSMMDWVELHVEGADDEEQSSRITAFWAAHFPFAYLPNGDQLTIDMRDADPKKQGVRYFSHEEDGLHGAVMSPDFFTFISGWTALGCIGAEWWSWEPFLHASDKTHHEFDVRGALAAKWQAWLAKDPDIVEEGAQPKPVVASSDADKALLLAAQRNDLKAVRAALASGAHPDAEDFGNLLDPSMYSGFSKGKTALRLAADHNHVEMLSVLLDAGASLAAHENLLAGLLLHTGSEEHANTPTLLWLIERGARIDPWPDERFSALHRLYDNQNLSDDDYLALLDAMLVRGCDVNVPWDRESVGAKTTLLMHSGPITQERLLRAGADPGLRDLRGRTAMHFVNFDDQVALLQQHGLDVNDLACPDDEDDVADRPLQYVLIGFHAEAPVEAVKALLAHGADPALPDGMGRNAWWYCSHVECADLLEPRLAFDPAMRDDKGGTVLHRAVHYSHRIDGSAIPLLGWWVQHGLDVNAEDLAGNTALHWMASFYDGAHDDESIRALVEQGARWDVVNAAGKTAREMLKKKFQKKVW